MKTTTLAILGTLAPLFASAVEWTDELRLIESQQVKLWQDTLESVRDKSPRDQLDSLWLGLRNMGYRRSNYDGHSVEVDRIFKEIQSTMLSIPGHARYFANEIKREQKEVAKYPTSTGPRISYDFNRSKYFVTMSHLPSPETIAVLGEFLSDEIDTPRQKISPHSDWGESPRANSFGASVTIAAIGLREAPASKDSYDADPDAHLAKTRAWWEQVKSGQRAFSFKGQAVEFRFKSDGTWNTIPIANPPDDGRKPIHKTTTERPEKRPVSVRADTPESLIDYSWWWYGIGGAALLALGAWLMRKITVG